MACKVKSKEATRIDKETYAHFADIVEHGAFVMLYPMPQNSYPKE
ncbi:hypothetical protein [Amedibacillus dolichus]|nr:hypothetical protein [Amedibacillus dolichus]